MTVEFRVRRLDPGEVRPPFDCKDDDLNEFFHVDSTVSDQQLVSVTYVAETIVDNEAIAFFSVSNDAVKKEDLTSGRRGKFLKKVPRQKQYKSLPAVKIGRLGVCEHMQGNGIGQDILDYIKMSFTDGNKTGCRFILVDAYNKDRVLKFYQSNDFDFLIPPEEGETTRLMFFDLIRFKESD